MRFGIIALSCLLLMASLAIPANADATQTTCAVLFDFGNGQIAWSDVNLTSGMNALNVTRLAAEEQNLVLSEQWGFVSSINGLGYNATTGEYWNFWTWDSDEAAWVWAMVGPADVDPSSVSAIAWSYAASADPSSFAAPYAPLATPDHRYPWTSYRHDSLNSGSQPGYAPNNVTAKWEVDLANGAIDAPIVSANGLQYVVTSGVLNFTTFGYDTNSTVFCLNSTGGIVWSQPIGKGYQVGSPLIYGPLLIVPSANGRIYAFDRETGAPQWDFDTQSGTVFGSPSPITYRSLIYVASGDGGLFALRNNGSLVWNASVASSIYSSSPAAWNGTIYIGGEDGKLHAFSADDGSGIWTAAVGGRIRGFPVITESAIVVSFINYTGPSATGGGLAWIGFDGQVQKYVQTGPSPASPVRTASGFATITATDLYMVSPLGTLLWDYSLGTTFVGAAPSSVDGTIFLVTNEAQSRVMAFSEKGALYWQLPLSPDQYALSSPTVADGVLFVSSDNGYVYAFDLNTVPPSGSITTNVVGMTVDFAWVMTSESSLFEYTWNFGDGQTGTGKEISHMYANYGNFTVTTTATNFAGQTYTVSRNVSIAYPTPPAASFTFSVNGMKANFVASSGIDSSLFTCTWSFGDGSTGQGRDVNHTYAKAGNFTVTLTVSNQGGQSTNTSHYVNIVSTEGEDNTLLIVGVLVVIVVVAAAAVFLMRRRK